VCGYLIEICLDNILDKPANQYIGYWVLMAYCWIFWVSLGPFRMTCLDICVEKVLYTCQNSEILILSCPFISLCSNTWTFLEQYLIFYFDLKVKTADSREDHTKLEFLETAIITSMTNHPTQKNQLLSVPWHKLPYPLPELRHDRQSHKGTTVLWRSRGISRLHRLKSLVSVLSVRARRD
jgi:hypothetical protein